MKKKTKNINVCFFIFARKGSKGLKNKNIKKIQNKSLFEHSLNFAKKLKIGDVVISSNINKIENYCKKNKIFFIKRPTKLASSKSEELLSWKHALRQFEKLSKKNVDIFVSLPPVSPLRNIDYLKKAIEKIQNDAVDMVVSTIESDIKPNFNLFLKKKNRLTTFNNIKKTYQRQSSSCTLVVPNFYVCKRKYVLSTKNIFNGKIYPLDVTKKYSLDINDEFDFKLTKLLIEKN